jgi:hypothetical protein
MHARELEASFRVGLVVDEGAELSRTHALGRLDQDHFRAEVGEHLAGDGGATVAEIKNA